MYGLRKIRKNGKNDYNNFVWPLEVGAEVEASDWNSKPECGGGLHCLPNAQGHWYLLHGHYWAVLEFDEKDMILIDSGKCKVKKCKIVFLSENPEGLLQFFDHEKFDSETAYWWARNIGNKDIMIDKITDSHWAYYWADNFGNRDIMIDRITESQWAYRWAYNFGDRDIMIDRITEPVWAYTWAYYIGNKDIMIDRITDVEIACIWTKQFGDKDIMAARFPEIAYRFALSSEMLKL